MSVGVEIRCHVCGAPGALVFPTPEERKENPGWVYSWPEKLSSIVYRHAFECTYYDGCGKCGAHARYHVAGSVTTRVVDHLPDCEMLLPTRPSWDEIYIGFALALSERSTCQRLQVGCVVVSGDNQRVLAIGYNGSWRGGPNKCDTAEPGACGCIHAETNAMVKFDPREGAGAILYTTDSPCQHCAKLIVNAGITDVRYDRLYRKPEQTEEIFRRAKVSLRKATSP